MTDERSQWSAMRNLLLHVCNLHTTIETDAGRLAMLDAYASEAMRIAARAAPAQPNDNKTDVIEPHPMLSPTHYCKDCGALWRQNDDFSMSLRSSHPCEACDNTPVGGQLFPLTEIPLPAIPPVSMRPFGYLKQTSSEKNPPHGWSVRFNDGEVPIFTAQQMDQLRQEADRAWKEVDAIAKERDDHGRWRQKLADDLGEVEKVRDVLARTVNDQERELGLLRAVRDAAADLWHGSWEPLHDALDAVRPCTCHPDDNPPVPCPHKYALSECRAAAMKEGT